MSRYTYKKLAADSRDWNYKERQNYDSLCSDVHELDAVIVSPETGRPADEWVESFYEIIKNSNNDWIIRTRNGDPLYKDIMLKKKFG
jgi:hypothetical protein